MTSARPTAASAAAIAIEKIATITPVGFCDGDPKRQKAMKFRFAAASMSSIPIRMKIACLRLNAASKPTENSAAEMMRQSWRVGVMSGRFWSGSERLQRAGFVIRPKRTLRPRRDKCVAQKKFAIAWTRSPARCKRALPNDKIRHSSPFLHHQYQRADQRGGEQQADALQRPDIIRHQHFTDAFDGERFDRWRNDGDRRRFQNCPDEPSEDGQRHDRSAPIETARLFIFATGEQDREDDQDGDRAYINEYLDESDEFSPEQKIKRGQSDERDHEAEGSGNQFPPPSRRQRAAQRENCDDDESRGIHSANR